MNTKIKKIYTKTTVGIVIIWLLYVALSVLYDYNFTNKLEDSWGFYEEGFFETNDVSLEEDEVNPILEKYLENTKGWSSYAVLQKETTSYGKERYNELWSTRKDTGNPNIRFGKILEGKETTTSTSWTRDGNYYLLTKLNIEDDIYFLAVYPKKNIKDRNYFLLGSTSVVLLLFILIYRFLDKHIREKNEEVVKGLTQNLHSILNFQEPRELVYQDIELNNPEYMPLSQEIQRTQKTLEAWQDDYATNKDQLETLLDAFTLGVIFLDKDGIIRLVNNAASQMLNVNQIGQSYLTTIKSTLLTTMIRESFTEDKDIVGDVEVTIPTTIQLDVHVIKMPEMGLARDGKGLDKGRMVLLYDLTRIRELEGAQIEFVTNASHELRTPITAIRGFAETLADTPDLTAEESQQIAKIILKESERLEDTLQDILLLSKVGKAGDASVNETFDVVKSIEHVITYFERSLEEKKLRLRLDIKPKTLIMRGNYQRVERIFINILANAIQYSYQGGRIWMTLEEVDGNLVWSVEDEGIGIPEKELDNIFERFYRVDKARARYTGGTGLGLAIVKSLVNLMKGTIEIESRVQIGTKVTVELPLN